MTYYTRTNVRLVYFFAVVESIMKCINRFAQLVAVFNSLILLSLGARIESAPDVFAQALAQIPADPAQISQLATLHSVSFFALGLGALVAAALPGVARWLLLIVLSGAGVVAYAQLWQLDWQLEHLYTGILAGLLAFNGISAAFYSGWSIAAQLHRSRWRKYSGQQAVAR
jgi:hypothetical protein